MALRPAVLASSLLLNVFTLPLGSATKYSLVEELKGKDFLRAYDFYQGRDPNDGFVQFVILLYNITHHLLHHILIAFTLDLSTKTPPRTCTLRP